MGKLVEQIRFEKSTFGICLLLALVVWGVFGQTHQHGFVNYDDGMYVYENPVISKGVTLEGMRWILTHPHGNNWHPLTSLSHMLDCQLYGLNPAGHHRTNVLLHMATVILFFLVLRQMTGSLWRSAFVAAVFAIHPLRVESVAWISERKDVLSGLFFMLTLGAYLRYVRPPFSAGRYAAVAVFFALGLMSKTMLVTLPFVLLLLDFWPLGRFQALETKKPIVRLVLEKIPLLLLAIVFCGITVWAQRGSIVPGKALPVLSRFGNACCSYAIYIKQMILPTGLAPFYPYPKAGLAFWKIGLSLILLAGISLPAFIKRKKRPYLLVGWLWYLGMLVPVIGIMQVGDQAHADRYTYLPQIGLVIMTTWLVTDWCASLRYRRAMLFTAAAAVLTVLSIAAHRQTQYWHDSFSFWTHTLACTDGNSVAHINLGTAFYKKGLLDEAVEQYEEVLKFNPENAEANSNLGALFARQGLLDKAMFHLEKALRLDPEQVEAHNGLGIVFFRQRRADKATSHFKKALEIQPLRADIHSNLGALFATQGQLDKAVPHFEKALQINPEYAKAHVNLGVLFTEHGLLDKAILHFEKALQINPEYAEAHSNLGAVFVRQGQIDKAIPHFEKTLEMNPGDAKGHCNLGNLLLSKKNFGKAIHQYDQAIRINPDDVEVKNNLAWLLATCPDAALRDGKRAVELALSVDRLTGGGYAPVLDALAAAYAEAGRYPEAVATARRALEAAADNEALAVGIRKRLELYRAGHPYHESGEMNSND